MTSSGRGGRGRGRGRVYGPVESDSALSTMTMGRGGRGGHESSSEDTLIASQSSSHVRTTTAEAVGCDNFMPGKYHKFLATTN